ncbi:MATE family efflux transporter [Selenomonas sputigena]|uniref:MATE family efflux transporter n=1 Tax=Selenomonas sputigena TaxID=69823 RepID=A0ABV3X4F3_9FIRM
MAKDMTEGSPARLILFFTLPLIAGNIMQQLYAFIDTLLVGRFLGIEALAAVGSTGSLMFLLLGFVIGLTSGFSICTGQRYGARDADGVRRSAAACAVLSLSTALVLSVVGFFFCRPLLEVMNTPRELLDNATAFFSIICGGTIFATGALMAANILRALGDSKMPTLIIGIGIAVNIALEVLFLLVFGWGIPGAAFATVVSWAFATGIFLVYIARRVPELHVRRDDWRLSWSFLREHLEIGLPMGFQASIIAFGAVILQVALNGLGPVSVAAYAAAQKVDTIAMMPMMSFGAAMAAYTAQNYGAGKFSRIRDGVRKCSWMSVGFSIVGGALIIVAGPSVMELFVGAEEQEAIRLGQLYLTVNGLTYWILAFLFIFRYTLQGLGQSIVPTVAGVMELIMRATAGIFLVDVLGFLGASLGNPMAWLGSCVPLAAAYVMTVRRLPKEGR